MTLRTSLFGEFQPYSRTAHEWQLCLNQAIPHRNIEAARSMPIAKARTTLAFK